MYAVLNVRRLTILREVARGGSFSAAAKALCLTPSAVSQQMHTLERESGAILFERAGSGVRLTEAGRSLVSHADAILIDVAEAEAQLKAINAGRRGRLRLGSFPTATAAFAARAVETFRRRYSDIDVHFEAGRPHESLARLKARELDLAVVFDLDRWNAGRGGNDGEAHHDGGEVEYIHLFDEQYLIVVPRDHRLAVRDTVELEELAGERIMGSPPSCGPWGPDLQHACRLKGFEPRLEPLYRTSTFRDVQSFVAAGRGVSMLPCLALSAARSDVVARPLRPAVVRHVKIALPAGGNRSQAAAAMVDALRESTHGLRTALTSV